MFSRFQFCFQFKFGYKLKRPSAAGKIGKDSAAIQTGCRKDKIKLRGPVDHSSEKHIPNIFAHQGYENSLKIFGFFFQI